MSQRTRTLVSALKVAVVAVITVMLFVLVLNAMRNPVDAKTSDFSAEFTDASGLHVNGDVRMKGMRIGKVNAVELKQDDTGKPIAHVDFSMDKKFTLTDTTKLAIKYQSLTGVRYLDVAQDSTPGRPVSSIDAQHTTPSYDITLLFNGLQPVLSTMNTDQINEFSRNAIALLQGDGDGLGPMLDSAAKLADYATDRQKVISVLTANMARIADSMGGRSRNVLGFLEAANIPISNGMKVLNEFQKTATTGPALVEPIYRILAAMGFNEQFDIDTFLRNAYHSMSDALASFKLMPSALAGLTVSQNTGASKKCSKGKAQIPGDVKVLLGGSEVVLCAK
ncbi:MCE family protein [Gordonia sp. TBRC 11910]|uniref:MCE family protein n=1 Tax=Gordonia asplenii TaxID=2725283 RepID=A0A848L546_9ACTN|nr:MlaD family protein [Gordonia asplenii]NMO03743.1 MCE family protein [Gordonia asplenii]